MLRYQAVLLSKSANQVYFIEAQIYQTQHFIRNKVLTEYCGFLSIVVL